MISVILIRIPCLVIVTVHWICTIRSCGRHIVTFNITVMKGFVNELYVVMDIFTIKNDLILFKFNLYSYIGNKRSNLQQRYKN